jgi:hypothetical protein
METDNIAIVNKLRTYLLINLGSESLCTYTLARSKNARMNRDSRKKMAAL